MANHKPTHYKSMITGNQYPYSNYLNHGKGGLYNSNKDLPTEDYPYTMVFEPEPEPVVYNNNFIIERIYVKPTKELSGGWMYRCIDQ